MRLSEEAIRAGMTCPWHLTVLEETDSTNNVLKREPDAPHGAVVIAARQTGGRGRLGRSFASPEGGLYLSVLLRLKATPEELLRLTPVTAVAVRRAIEDCCGLKAGIKWPNDLVFGGKKLCGILTELLSEDGTAQRAVIGIGINCNTESFPPEVRQMAASLRELTGAPVDRNRLAAAVITRLFEMDKDPFSWEAIREYAGGCVTLRQAIQVERGGRKQTGLAFGLDKNGCLLVRWDDGTAETLTTGEVSVRGMYGYA